MNINNNNQETDKSKELYKQKLEQRRREKRTQNSSLKYVLFTFLLGLCSISFLGVIIKIIYPDFFYSTTKCSETQKLLLEKNQYNLKGEINPKTTLCYQILAKSQDSLVITYQLSEEDSSSLSISIINPAKETKQINPNTAKTILFNNSEKPYLLVIKSKKKSELFNINLKINQANSPKNISKIENQIGENQEFSNQTISNPSTENNKLNFESKQIPNLAYNVGNNRPFYQDEKLKKIVDKVVDFAENRSLPTKKLSISLVDLTQQNQLRLPYGFYEHMERRYPASLVKLFWMVALFGQYQAGVLPEGTIPEKTLAKMIKDSDNEAASRVLDAITNSESGTILPKPEITYWQQQRESVNNFFASAGYFNLNISQKTFPIPYLQMNLPSGRDAQIRSETLTIPEKEVNPIRNYVTTYDVARLLYEIRDNISVSTYYSDRMDELLTRDLNPEVWKPKPYNAIAGFLGEYLPANTHFASKMGWTFSNRNDAAIIASPDGKAHYILVIFGDDPAYYKDKTFLPEASLTVYQEMLKKNTNNEQVNN